MESAVRRLLTGWGRNKPTAAMVTEAVTEPDLHALLAAVPPRGLLARGLGRSYGDAAQNAGGAIVRLAAGDGEITVDSEAKTCTAPGGATLDTLLRTLVPRGYFLPVTPGTRQVTVGGAIASDVHGKNHHADGSFGSHVRSIRLLLSSGEAVTVGPDRDPELFWATVAGMGLTGVILEATFGLLPIETSRMRVDTDRLEDLDALLEAMSDERDEQRYSVAWIDLAATGKHLGRSVLTRADHAVVGDLPRRERGEALAFIPRQLLTVFAPVPGRGLLTHRSIAAFNALWYRKAPRRERGGIETIGSFFHPLDLIGEWARLYGRPGLVQYQLVIPFEQTATMRAIVERISARGAASFLAVLKRMGPANPAPLSFPRPGWTLALDLPANAEGVERLLHELDEMVLAAGGRNYFAKDAHTTPDVVRAGYPRLAEWQAVQRRADPAGVWNSDLARRLALLAPA